MAVRRTDIHTHVFKSLQTTQTGLEPVTSAVTGRRSNQLSHGAIKVLYLQNFIQMIRLSQFFHNNILALLVCPLSYQFEKYQLDSASLHLATICFANPVQKVLALVQASLPHAVHFCPLLFFSFSID